VVFTPFFFFLSLSIMGFKIPGLGKALVKAGAPLLKNAAQMAASAIPGVGGMISNMIGKINIQPKSASQVAEATSKAKSLVDAGVSEDVAVKVLNSHMAKVVDDDPDDDRFPITGGSDSGKSSGGGFGKKDDKMGGQKDRSGAQRKGDAPGAWGDSDGDGKMDVKGFLSDLWDLFWNNRMMFLVMGILLYVVARVPQVRRMIFGTMGQVRTRTKKVYMRAQQQYRNYRSKK